MSQNKDETITIRTTHKVKELLRRAAVREHRSIASMLEVLILTHAEKNELTNDTRATRKQA